MIFLCLYILSVFTIEFVYGWVTNNYGDLGEYDGVSAREAITVIELIPILNTVVAVMFVQSFISRKL